jgi:hypothetical protein
MQHLSLQTFCKNAKWTSHTKSSVTKLKTQLNMASDVPPNSLRNPNVGPRVKQQKQKKIKACSLVRNTSRVGGCA